MIKSIAFYLAVLTPALARAESSATMNFRVNPIGHVLAGVSLIADFKIDPQWTIGPMVEVAQRTLSSDKDRYTEDFRMRAFGAGARANYFHNGVFTDGFYVGPSLQYAKVNLKTRDFLGEITGDASMVLVSAVAGYGWFWTNFNFMLGAGFTASAVPATITVTDSTGYKESINTRLAGLAIELALGWTF